MHRDFWHARWNQGQIGFHEGAPNAFLTKHAAQLASESTRVLVPFCGKTRDLAWLASLGHEVVGVELSPIAAQAFFDESSVTPERTTRAPLESLRGDGVEILVGDFFDVTRAHVGEVTCAYDRAALVALPPDMQRRYVAHLLSLLPPGARILLVALEYEQSRMDGPPFSVTEATVRALFEERCTIEHLDSKPSDERPRFREIGAVETAWLLTLRA